MTITEVLIAEHASFVAIFEQLERRLPQCTTVAEVRMLAGLVAGMLQHHGETEKQLALSALDHVLAEQGHLEGLHQDHQEIDTRLHRIDTVADLDEARRLLVLALVASRKHFRHEERELFPRIDQLLQADTLARLGEAYLDRYLGRKGGADYPLPDAA